MLFRSNETLLDVALAQIENYDDLSLILTQIRSHQEVIDDNTGEINLEVQDLTFTIGTLLPIVIDMNATLNLLEIRVKAIEEQVVKIEEHSSTINTNVGKIWDYLEGNSFAARVIKVLNEDVTSMQVDSFVSAQIDFDVCEYDPLGVGPINCEGGQIEAIELTGIKVD